MEPSTEDFYRFLHENRMGESVSLENLHYLRRSAQRPDPASHYAWLTDASDRFLSMSSRESVTGGLSDSAVEKSTYTIGHEATIVHHLAGFRAFETSTSVGKK